MRNPSLKRTEHDTLLLSGLDAGFALCLGEVPTILEERTSPAAHRRLFPDPTSHDHDWNNTWRQVVTPELAALFQSAQELMAKDLLTMEKEPGQKLSYRVRIPVAHVDAWMSALNQARLILGAEHDVTEPEMAASAEFDSADTRRIAVLKIHLLGHLLQLLVDLQDGGAPTDDPPA